MKLERCVTVPLNVVVAAVEPSEYEQDVLTSGFWEKVTIASFAEPDAADPFTLT
jgi:hypothetical protein